MEYNKYINSFPTENEYESYINGNIAEGPNVALIDNTGVVKYVKEIHIIEGTTASNNDFKIGSSIDGNSPGDAIQIHIKKNEGGINELYANKSDALKPVKYFSEQSVFANEANPNGILTLTKFNIDTSNLVSLDCLFYGCTGLTQVNLSRLDTSSVTGMNGMFFYCQSLTSLDLKNFNTSNVISMALMFYVCDSLIQLDLSNFDTSKVTDIQGMFSNCASLSSLDISGFDTSKVTNMTEMFNYCQSLTQLDLRSFNTINVTDMPNMFGNCDKLNKLYLSSSFFNSTRVKNYDFSPLISWTDTETLAKFVEAITVHDGTGKTVTLSTKTKNVLTQTQKNAITAKGWTIV